MTKLLVSDADTTEWSYVRVPAEGGLGEVAVQCLKYCGREYHLLEWLGDARALMFDVASGDVVEFLFACTRSG